jgi:hypothetical protein
MKYLSKYKLFENKVEPLDYSERGRYHLNIINDLLFNLNMDNEDVDIRIENKNYIGYIDHYFKIIQIDYKRQFNPSAYEQEIRSVVEYIESIGYTFFSLYSIKEDNRGIPEYFRSKEINNFEFTDHYRIIKIIFIYSNK